MNVLVNDQHPEVNNKDTSFTHDARGHARGSGATLDSHLPVFYLWLSKVLGKYKVFLGVITSSLIG